MRYRLEASPDKLGALSETWRPEEDHLEACEALGWTYVASRGQFYIYRTDDPQARELDTDPQVQAIALELVCRRQREAAATCFFWAILYPAVQLGRQPLLLLMEAGTWFVLWGTLLLLWSFGLSVAEVVHLARLRKRLAAGQPLSHHSPWQRHAVLHRLARWLPILLLVVWLVLLLQGWSASVLEEDKIPLADYTGQVPFATMADFAPEGTYHTQDVWFSNTVAQGEDWLAPVIIHWQETGSLRLADGSTVSGGLSVDYYETLTPWLAREAARELRARDKGERYFTPLELSPLEVDYQAAYTAIFPTVILQRGNTALRATFYQTSDTTIPLEQWALALAESLPPSGE